MIILCLISQKIDGIMIAVPRYPLYTADITIKEGTIIPYFLDEENKWALSITSLEKSYEQAVSEGVKVKFLYFKLHSKLFFFIIYLNLYKFYLIAKSNSSY